MVQFFNTVLRLGQLVPLCCLLYAGTYDVQYILGGREQGIHRQFIQRVCWHTGVVVPGCDVSFGALDL